MATYKLIQDIEAEDHILGPLTLRQFIFALIAIFCFYMCFIGITKSLYPLFIFLPPGIFFGFFALPFGRDQPTEIWFLAKLRFWFKPRRRIWNQSGIKELVTITAPKKIERVLTNGLSENEVQSRLSALANTLDSRGWAVKNAGIGGGGYSHPNPMMAIPSDRLIDINNIPQEVPGYEVHASDDILDEASNPIAQQFDTMITQSAQARRQHMMDVMNGSEPVPAPQAAPTDNYWFMNPPAANSMPAQTIQAGSSPQPYDNAATPDETDLNERLKQAHGTVARDSREHTKIIQPLNAQAAAPVVSTVPEPMAAPINTAAAPLPPEPVKPSAATPDPAILTLAHNDDLNVATLARQASKNKDNESSQEEVVISLH